MENKSNNSIFFDNMPAFKVWYKVLPMYVINLLLFIIVIFIFWKVGSEKWYGALLVQIILSSLLSIHFIIIANKSDKIRKKYLKKYKELAIQKYWFNFQSYTIPFISAAYYFPLLLINYDFLPRFLEAPNHFLNNSLMPFYISMPLGIIIIIIGFLMKRPSGGFGMDYDNYIYTIIPEKSKLITAGLYQYIRNPQYLSRGIISMGFGVVANNISAILLGFIHFVSYCAIIPEEDKELFKRYGEEFEEYKSKVPAVFPKLGSLKPFFKLVIKK